MKKLTTPEKIQEQILKTFQEKKEHFKGKIPQKLKDIPKKFLQPSYMKQVRDYETGGWKKERVENIHWTKARTKISNSKRTTRNTPKFDTNLDVTIEPRQERVDIKDIEMTISLPSNMTAKAFIDFVAMIKKSGAKYSL